MLKADLKKVLSGEEWSDLVPAITLPGISEGKPVLAD